MQNRTWFISLLVNQSLMSVTGQELLDNQKETSNDSHSHGFEPQIQSTALEG